MALCVQELVSECNSKLSAILKTRRYYGLDKLVQLFKSHVLSYLEYRTSAIYHATESVLAPLDGALTSFLKALDLSEEEAFEQQLNGEAWELSIYGHS